MNAPAAPAHEAILASAGSGKTHALVTRYVQLLAHGVPPERIVALTFTRKAASEFFDKILQRLAEAVLVAGKCEQLASDIGRPGLSAADVRGWLRVVIDALPRLSLGTLDSFFIRVVSVFGLELGLGGPFQLLEGAEIENAREELCRRVFQALPEGRQHEQEEFLQAFDLATFGAEEKSLHRAFDAFIEEHHLAWMQDPVLEKWGRPTSIWPRLPWYLEREPSDANELQAAFAAAIEPLTLQPRQRTKLISISEALAAHPPGTATSGKFTYFRDNILPHLSDIRSGRATVKIWNPVTLEGPACESLAALIGRFLAGEAWAMVNRTQGLAAILRDYEFHHQTEVRRQGRLTYDDVKFLLARGGVGGDGLARLAVDARLDARFDHWLIDEFQDTSLLQWEVLRPLVEEALEDPEGGRTYFQVGDEKQSIYRWRGGEPELGRHIIDRYRLPTRPLNQSWRSSPAVIDAVNAVFGADGALRTVVPAETADRWRAGWTPHTTVHTGRAGCAALIRPQPASDEAEENAFERELEAVAAWLREIRPLERGLTVALLLRGNDDVAAAVDFLRRGEDLPPIASETDAPVAVDNPLTLALVSLLRTAAHPGDTMAWEHVRMTPLADHWEPGEGSRGHVVRQTLQQILAHGFAGWVRDWSERLEPSLAPDDQFSRQRAGQLLDLARAFDARGSRDIDDFLRAATAATARESSQEQAVQVMTIHKSKGLDFDIVFLPRLAGKSFHDDSRHLLLRERGSDFDTRWIVRRPAGELVAADEVLAAARDAGQAAQAYEGLCVLYVAMTRARRGLFLIGDAGSGKGKGRHAAAFIERALDTDSPPVDLEADGRSWSCGWLAGDPRWFESIAPPKEAPVETADAARPVFVPQGAGARRLPRLTPSSRESHVLSAVQIFSSEASPARELGTLVHALFERIDDPEDRTTMEIWWQATHPSPEMWQADAWRQVTSSLDDPGVRARLQVPAGAELWREKRFEAVVEEGWVTGTFDRVVIGRNQAWIVDYKTDAVADEAAAQERARGYRPQLDLYRRVVRLLTGIPLKSIQPVLIFTRGPWVVEIT